MATVAYERETLVVFSDEDRLGDGMARVYTFQPSLRRKALACGGKVVREHKRKGKVEAWDIEIPAKQVRIAFRRAEKNPARVEAARKRAAAKMQQLEP